MLAWYTLSVSHEPCQADHRRACCNGHDVVVTGPWMPEFAAGQTLDPEQTVRMPEARMMVQIRQLPLPCVKRNSTERYDSNAQIGA